MKRYSYFIIFVLFMMPLLALTSDDYDDLRQQSKAVTITYYHDILKSFEGTFRQIFFFTPPEAKPENGDGKSINKVILNERYLEINSELKFGKDIVSRKIIIGYDGMSEKYKLTQYSNLETYSLTADGVFDSESKSLIFTGKYPYAELNPASFSVVLQFDNPDEFSIIYYEIDNHISSKILEIKNYKLSN